MANPRIGDWMQTASARKFWPLDPHPEDIDISDIAHALSLICRFGGHCREFYSVAEHCVHVSLVAARLAREAGADAEESRAVALAGLLHDASEAYLGDMIRPLKHQPEMAAYRAAEVAVAQAIAERFGLPWPMHPEVKQADEVLLATEARDIMGGESAGKWRLHAAPMAEVLCPMTPTEARTAFMTSFDLHGGKR